MNKPYGVALDASGLVCLNLYNFSADDLFFRFKGNVYIGDNSNHRVRKVTVSTGIITTIAGTGTSSFSGDSGQATSATLKGPYGVAVDSSGNVYVADYFNNRIRKVMISTGIITSIAGSSTSAGYSGDNGPATSAKLYYPTGVALDSAGS